MAFGARIRGSRGVVEHHRRNGNEFGDLVEFKKWLKKFDANRDGRISAEELRKAICDVGRWVSKNTANRVVNSVDTNSNGFIDDNEINELLGFAVKELGFKIVAR